MRFKTILTLIPVLLFLIFVLQNMRIVEVKFLFWTVSMSRALMLLGTLVIGLATGWVIKSLSFKKSRS